MMSTEPRSEFETVLEISVSGSEWVFTRRGELLGGINHVNRSLLKLHRVATGGNCNADESLCQIHVAIVIDANFRDDVAGLARTHKPVANFHSISHWSYSYTPPGDCPTRGREKGRGMRAPNCFRTGAARPPCLRHRSYG